MKFVSRIVFDLLDDHIFAFSASYDPRNPVPSHFTQVVWKSTTKVGCAVHMCNGIFDPKFGVSHSLSVLVCDPTTSAPLSRPNSSFANTFLKEM